MIKIRRFPVIVSFSDLFDNLSISFVMDYYKILFHVADNPVDESLITATPALREAQEQTLSAEENVYEYVRCNFELFELFELLAIIPYRILLCFLELAPRSFPSRHIDKLSHFLREVPPKEFSLEQRCRLGHIVRGLNRV
jgi:hypothetical protein